MSPLGLTDITDLPSVFRPQSTKLCNTRDDWSPKLCPKNWLWSTRHHASISLIHVWWTSHTPHRKTTWIPVSHHNRPVFPHNLVKKVRSYWFNQPVLRDDKLQHKGASLTVACKAEIPHLPPSLFYTQFPLFQHCCGYFLNTCAKPFRSYSISVAWTKLKSDPEWGKVRGRRYKGI